jgi:23S rRNA (pseudouridine1915-N3)-methyltransferase
MLVTLTHVTTRAGGKDATDILVREYLGRCAGFMRCDAEAFRSESALLEWLERQRGRTAPMVVLLDSRGKQMKSEEFAAWMGARRDDGTQMVVFGIGPADGWSAEARGRAQMLLSLGAMTLAHSLARLVIAEQIYRAYAILTGHPYHVGH